MMEAGLFPSDWIYENIFHLSEDQYDELRDLINMDAERKFRTQQIQEEGNDPKKTGRSYGTPHDLASLYGEGRMYSDPGNVPDGYDKDKELGRPEEKSSNLNTQDNALGKDRLGVERMKGTDNNDSDSIKPKFNKSPLALAERDYKLRYRDMLKNAPRNIKKLIFEVGEQGDLFLDEANIKEPHL